MVDATEHWYYTECMGGPQYLIRKGLARKKRKLKAAPSKTAKNHAKAENHETIKKLDNHSW